MIVAFQTLKHGLAAPQSDRRSAHRCQHEQEGRLFRDGLLVSCSGGERNRTPVRDKIDHSVYVRILLIEVSVCWPTESPHPDKSAFVLPDDGRRAVGPARICDTHVPPRAGCLVSTAR